MNAGGYDEGYQSCPCFWGTNPSSLVKLLLTLAGSVENLAVLDAGCGEGKNAIFLASLGAMVRAFDLSEIAIRHAKEWAPNKSFPKVSFEVADVRSVLIPRFSYDVVIAYGLLHCLADCDEVVSVVNRLKAACRERGVFILCAFNDRSQDLSAHPGFHPVLLPHDIYISLFAGWELLHCSDEDLTEIHPHNEILHTHSMTRILARKIAS